MCKEIEMEIEIYIDRYLMYFSFPAGSVGAALKRAMAATLLAARTGRS